jgi:hypothetical protein
MKRITSLFVMFIAVALISAGCGSKLNDQKWTLDKKHQPLADFVLNAPQKVQETYIMASKYPEVVASVPCFCGCAADGHKSNLDCFVKKMGPGNAVEEWDTHGIS